MSLFSTYFGARSVKDPTYGAKGDGTTDDTAAIQAAVTAANGAEVIFPPGTYKTTAPIQLGTNFHLSGAGAVIVGNFNGFVFDTLTSPYNAISGICIIEDLNIQNSFSGNNFTVTGNGTWSSSGSPVNITLTGANPGIAASGALWINDSRFSTNAVFVGMITSVASYPTITVSSAAVASGATSNLAMKVVQCYAANGSWLAGASSITMATTPPAGIGNGQYYVYDYEDILADPKTNFNRGVATWSGTTLTFTPGTGVVGASVGASDRLWLAPVAGCIRYSSVVGATVRNCTISGFIGVTSSEDKIVANDPTLGAAEGFHIKVDTCNFSNPSGCSAVPGQTDIYLQNNSLSINTNHNSAWCAWRLSGTAVSIIGGRAEVGYFGILIAGDDTATNNAGAEILIASVSLESNLLGLYSQNAGNANINGLGASCNAVNPIAGFWFNSFSGVVQNSAAQGNFGAGYGIYVADPGTSRQNFAMIAVSGVNNSTPSQSWRLPSEAWWGTCIQCDNPASSYLFGGLPSGVSSPSPYEGETYNISDSPTAASGNFAANVTVGGGANHVQVRWNGAHWTING